MPTVTIPIRPATPEDAAGIVRVQTETWLATYPNAEHGVTLPGIRARLAKRTDDEKIAQWSRLAADPNMLTLVADQAGQIVGFSNVSKGDSANLIGALYVLPEFQRHGLGKKMIRQALDWLGTDNPTRVEVASYNQKAITFYESFGFQTGKSMDEDPGSQPSGAAIHTIEMIRSPSGRAV